MPKSMGREERWQAMAYQLRGALRDEPYWAPEVRGPRIAALLREFDELVKEESDA
jgi:hypothetical protein